jgi:WD40 repeat protein
MTPTALRFISCLMILFTVAMSQGDVRTKSDFGERHAFMAHIGSTSAVSFASDGRFATAGEDGEVIIYSRDGKSISTISTGQNSTYSLSFNLNGKTLLIGSLPTAILVNTSKLNSFDKISEFETSGIVTLSSDGKRIATSCESQENSGLYDVCILNIENVNKVTRLRGLAKWFTAIAFSPNGLTVCAASRDGSVRLWDTNSSSGRERRRLTGNRSKVISLGFAFDNYTVLGGTSDGTSLFWDTRTGREIGVLKGHKSGVISVGFTRDGKRAFTASEDATVRIWNSFSKLEVGKITTDSAVVAAALSSDGKRIVTSTEKGSVRFWDALTGRALLKLMSHGHHVESMAFSSNGLRLLTGARGDVATIWDADTAKRAFNIKAKSLSVGAGFSPDGMSVAISTYDDTFSYPLIKVFDSQTGQALQTLQGLKSPAEVIAYSPDSRFIAAGDFYNNVSVWNLLNHSRRSILQDRLTYISNLTFSEDGRTLLAWGSGHLVTWSTDGNTESTEFLTGGHYAAFTLDGKRIAVSTESELRVFDTMTGDLILIIPALKRRILAFSPDQHSLLVTSDSNAVELWDTKTGDLVRTINRYKTPVQLGLFSPDGVRIALSVSEKLSVRILSTPKLDNLFNK